MTNTTSATFTLSASFESHVGPDAPQQVIAIARPATREDAEAIASAFPKSCRMYATVLGDGQGGVISGYVRFEARLSPSRNNGGRNETGIKRYRAFRKAAERLGFDVEFEVRPKSIDAYRTEDALHAAISS